MLGGAWLFISFMLLLAAVVLRQVPLLLVAVLFFLAAGVARLWARYVLDRLDYSRTLSANRVFFGETVSLDVHITNRKLLPLPWVHVRDEMPEEVTFLRGKTSPSHKEARTILPNLLSLGPYHRLTRRYPVQCLRRGFFSFGPASVASGDLFGFFRREGTIGAVDHLLVYPRIVPLEALGIPSREPFGDLTVRRHLFEDPVRAVSTRDYTTGDPLKRIHWKASARLQRLQSRVFEPTTTVDLALFLDTRTVEPPFWGRSEQLLETAVITAASVASYAVDHGFRFGLYVNESYRNSDRLIRFPPSDHPALLKRILEALAHVQGLPFRNLEQVLSREGAALPWSATIAAVTAFPSEALLATLARFRRAGRRVVLVAVGGETPSTAADGLQVYHVSDAVYWRELASLPVREARPESRAACEAES